jgi:hypothetical protein
MFIIGQNSASQIFVVAAGNSAPVLARMTGGGFTDVLQNFFVQSNAVVVNTDNDVQEEIVFVANYDDTNTTEPLAVGVGELSLIYLDPNGSSFDIRLLRKLGNYSPGSFQLSWQDIDDDGNSEYLSRAAGDDMAASSVVYHPESQILTGYEDPLAVPIALDAQISGGSVASSLNNRLVFCGAFKSGGTRAQNLLLFDPQSNLFSSPFSWTEQSTADNLFYENNKCYVARSESDGKEFVVSVRSDHKLGGPYVQYNEITIQQLPHGDIVFHKEVETRDIGYGEFMPVATGDIDGDGDLDVTYAADRQRLEAYDVAEGQLIASYTTPAREYISTIAIGRNPLPGQKPNVFVTMLEQMATLQLTPVSTFQQIAAKTYSRSTRIIATYTSDVFSTSADELIMVSTISPSPDNEFKIYDAALNEVSAWAVQNNVTLASPLHASSGRLMVTAEYTDNFSYNRDWRVFWREPLTGAVVYRSPLINQAGDVTGLDFFTGDDGTSLHMVVTATEGVLITP